MKASFNNFSLHFLSKFNFGRPLKSTCFLFYNDSSLKNISWLITPPFIAAGSQFRVILQTIFNKEKKFHRENTNWSFFIKFYERKYFVCWKGHGSTMYSKLKLKTSSTVFFPWSNRKKSFFTCLGISLCINK